jgi:hypothetical protein
MLADCTSIWHHSLISSSHYRLGLSRIPDTSIMPIYDLFYQPRVVHSTDMSEEVQPSFYHHLEDIALTFTNSSPHHICYRLLPSDVQDLRDKMSQSYRVLQSRIHSKLHKSTLHLIASILYSEHTARAVTCSNATHPVISVFIIYLQCCEW